jgi:hypothetical protein
MGAVSWVTVAPQLLMLRYPQLSEGRGLLVIFTIDGVQKRWLWVNEIITSNFVPDVL